MPTKKKGFERNTIIVPEHQPRKQTELQFLNVLEREFKDKDAYLSTLFTSEFIAWAKNKIKCDTMPNIMDELNNVMEMSREHMRVSKTDHDKLTEHYKQALDEAAEYAKKLGAAEAERDLLKEDIDKLRETGMASWNSAEEARDERDAALHSIEEMHQEINRLKAMLFDAGIAAKRD